jgi:integrase
MGWGGSATGISSASAAIVKSLDRLRTQIRLRHFSLRTEEAYAGWVRRYIVFHGKRHPDQLGEDEIRAFLSFLAEERNVSASTQNQALAALMFLYREVLGRPLEWVDVGVRAKRPARLPVKDIDFDIGEIRLRDGKGRKDRVTMLSRAVQAPLRHISSAFERCMRGICHRALAARFFRMRCRENIRMQIGNGGGSGFFPQQHVTSKMRPVCGAGIIYVRRSFSAKSRRP